VWRGTMAWLPPPVAQNQSIFLTNTCGDCQKIHTRIVSGAILPTAIQTVASKRKRKIDRYLESIYIKKAFIYHFY